MSASLPSNSARAGAVVGFLAMAILGWKAAEPARDAMVASESTEPAATKVLKRHERKASHGPPEHVRERLRAIRTTGSSGEKLRATLDLANSLPVADLAEWMENRWFDVGEGFDATLFKKIAMQRWMEEDPEGHAVWCLKNGNQSGILNQWAKDDPQRVIAFFQQHPNQNVELNVLQQIARNHPEIALARIKEMIGKGINTNQGTESYYIKMVMVEIARKDPAALQAAVASLPAKWQKIAESHFVSQRLKTDFANEIRSLWQMPDGLRLYREANGGGARLLDELANLPASWKAGIAESHYSFIDPNNAEKWLGADLLGNGFTAEQVKSIKSGALRYVAGRNPELAISQITSLNLDDSERRNLITSIFDNSMNWKPGKTESILAMLGSEEDRQFAKTQLEANRSSEESSPAKIEKPSDWLAKAATIDSNNGSSYQLFSLLDGWDKDKLAELSRDFRSLPDEQKAQVAEVIAENHYSSNKADPSLRGDAIRYLITHPPEETKPGRNSTTYLASSHAVNWAKEDPTAASAWVQNLPAGDAKLTAQKNLAANWAQYDPDAAAQWVKSLPSNARGEVEKFMQNPSSN